MGFGELAEDVAAAVHFLRRRPEIRGDLVGLWGISQAGWVLPIAAGASRPAFVITVSGAGTGATVAEQNLYDIGNQTRSRALGEEAETIVDGAWRALYALVRTGETGDGTSLREALRQASEVDGLSGLLPPRPSQIQWEARTQWFLALDIDFDALSIWTSLSMPVLAVYGGVDRSTQTEVTSARFERAMKAAGARATVHVVADGGHILLDGPLGEGDLLPEYVDAMDRWMSNLSVISRR